MRAGLANDRSGTDRFVAAMAINAGTATCLAVIKARCLPVHKTSVAAFACGRCQQVVLAHTCRNLAIVAREAIANNAIMDELRACPGCKAAVAVFTAAVRCDVGGRVL